MTMRILHFLVIVALVVAAAYVYEIKFDSTLQAERVAKLRGEIRRERDAVAALRAEWAKLDSPMRIEALAKRHLPLKPLDARQIDSLKDLPERPRPLVPPGDPDPIGTLLTIADETDSPTGAIGGRSSP